MENALQQTQTGAPVRDIRVITEEIKSIQQQANALALIYAVEIGRRLHEAKHVLQYGQWGEWIEKEVNFSQSTANNFMRLFEEYGSAQISIFGASVDSQTFAKLPYSKALALLAIPKDEREAFAEEVGAGDLSVKKLKEAIEERDKAQKVAEAQKKIKEELAEKLKASEDARAEALEKAAEAEGLRGLLNVAEQEAEQAKKEAEDLRTKLKEAEKNPKIPKATLDKLRKEEAAAAAAAAEKKTQKELEEARKKAETAEAEAVKAKLAEQQARESLAEAQKKLKTASPEVTAFKALFEELQRTAKACNEKIAAIEEADPETAGKLKKALAAFAETLKERA